MCLSMQRPIKSALKAHTLPSEGARRGFHVSELPISMKERAVHALWDVACHVETTAPA
jgi:hypothetical protein